MPAAGFRDLRIILPIMSPIVDAPDSIRRHRWRRGRRWRGFDPSPSPPRLQSVLAHTGREARIHRRRPHPPCHSKTIKKHSPCESRHCVQVSLLAAHRPFGRRTARPAHRHVFRSGVVGCNAPVIMAISRRHTFSRRGAALLGNADMAGQRAAWTYHRLRQSAGVSLTPRKTTPK
jgi:hypothetical protein